MGKEIYENPLCAKILHRRKCSTSSARIANFRPGESCGQPLRRVSRNWDLRLPTNNLRSCMQHQELTVDDCQELPIIEHKLRHDVMAHIKTYADACPAAAPIIHLGATSCFVGDNTDIIQMKEGLIQIKKLLLGLIAALADFAEKHKDTPTLAYTHFQAAQPTTAGKRACLWAAGFYRWTTSGWRMSLAHLKLLGLQGARREPAQAFLELFDG